MLQSFPDLIEFALEGPQAIAEVCLIQIQHFLCECSATPIDIFALIASLHPSAAVCGTPTDIANGVINELEDLNRGRYAGPVGWIDARGDGEIGIALRTGELSEDLKSMQIYSGCGIVAGSNPEDELAESQAKLSPMRTALETRV